MCFDLWNIGFGARPGYKSGDVKALCSIFICISTMVFFSVLRHCSDYHLYFSSRWYSSLIIVIRFCSFVMVLFPYHNQLRETPVRLKILEKTFWFLVLGQWHRHGEEVLENTLWILRGWAIPSWCPEAKPTDEVVLPQPRRMRRIFFQYLWAMPMPFPL